MFLILVSVLESSKYLVLGENGSLKGFMFGFKPFIYDF